MLDNIWFGIGLAINVFIIVTFIWISWTFIQSYNKAQGTTFERVWLATRESATILWAKMVILATGLVSGIAALAEVLDPSISEQIKSYLSPKYVAAFVMFTMVITLAARLRSLDK